MHISKKPDAAKVARRRFEPAPDLNVRGWQRGAEERGHAAGTIAVAARVGKNEAVTVIEERLGWRPRHRRGPPGARLAAGAERE